MLSVKHSLTYNPLVRCVEWYDAKSCIIVRQWESRHEVIDKGVYRRDVILHRGRFIYDQHDINATLICALGVTCVYIQHSIANNSFGLAACYTFIYMVVFPMNIGNLCSHKITVIRKRNVKCTYLTSWYVNVLGIYYIMHISWGCAHACTVTRTHSDL